MKHPWKILFIRKDSDLTTFDDVIGRAYDILWKHTGRKKEYLFARLNRNNIYYYINGVNEFEAGRPLYQRRFFTPRHIKKSYQEGLLFLKKTAVKTKGWQQILAEELLRKNLLLAFNDLEKDFKQMNRQYSILPWWALESWQYDFFKIINRLIAKNNLDANRSEIITQILKPWRKTAIEEIQDKFSRGAKVSQLVNNYQFLRSWTLVWHKPITARWIASVCKKQLPHQTGRLSVKQIIRMLKPDWQEKKYLVAAPYIIFFKDWRDDLRRRHAYYWYFLFKAIADYFHIKTDEVGYLIFDEIRQALTTGRLDKKIIARRKKFGCILTADLKRSRMKVVDKNAYAKYLKIAKQVDEIKGTIVIKGIIANQGIVSGRVCTIRHYKDVFKIKSGDILVANTTHPNYLLGMKKAAAFVTDEGGIASHAAIVAREMKKPCIVGAKIATKVLKDGDLVEVDANKGIVRKI